MQFNIKEIYNNVTSIWKKFCELHNDLYELTCSEYNALLESKIEKLDDLMNQKVNIISAIKEVEERRLNIIYELNKTENIKNVSDLLFFMKKYEDQSNDINI